MTEPSTPAGATPGTMRVLTTLLEARTGQQIAAYRSWRLDTALKPLLKERGLTTLDQLAALLRAGADPMLADRVADALVNAESSFFRDAAVFDLVRDAMAQVEATGRRPRLWSAGCSTGQEPLSLAMMFADRAAAEGLLVPEIVATDVSETALARARAGSYSQFEIQRGLPIRSVMKWFEEGGDGWVASPKLTRLVQYRALNLVADTPPPGRFDLVLCRNVLLYLAPEMKALVFATLAAALRPGGLLVLGAGETVIGQTPLFEPSRQFRGLYEKTAAATARAA